jgi:cysteine desulfurase / selenocysteine lyase
MNTEQIKKEFPILSKKDSFVYLDSAATSLTPEPVLEAMNEYYRTYRANIHRGLYKEALRATESYEEARERVALFIGAGTQEVVFCAGATVGANMLMHALQYSGLVDEGGTIVTTTMEHHALLLPVQRLGVQKKCTLVHVPFTPLYSLDYTALKKSITHETQIVAITFASNVLGTINDIARITALAHAQDALVIVDATAVVGHMNIDVHALDVDFLFFSGHKMCGPTGVGVLYGKQELLERLEPGFVGGGMVDTVTCSSATWVRGPEKFEAGTQNIGGVIGLSHAIQFIEQYGLDAIQQHCEDTVSYLIQSLRKVDGVTLYAAEPEANVGIVSFTIEGVHPHDVAEILGSRNIAVRAGHHCALPLHTALSIPASVRASVYMYTDRKDIDALTEGVCAVIEVFKK